MELAQVTQLADNLTRLAREFQTQEPEQAAALKRAFKGKSHNDLARTVVYLMEVVGVSDMRRKTLEDENKDLRGLLELNNIKIEGENDEKAQVETSPETQQEGQNIPATVSSDAAQDSSTGVI